MLIILFSVLLVSTSTLLNVRVEMRGNTFNFRVSSEMCYEKNSEISYYFGNVQPSTHLQVTAPKLHHPYGGPTPKFC
jgi:hypothetical protein